MYDGNSYTPVAKLTEEDRYAIVQDYLGTPIQALDSKGEVVCWDCVLGIYGEVFRLRGERDFIPFRFQGQYEDGKWDCTTIGVDTTRPRRVPIFLKTQ